MPCECPTRVPKVSSTTPSADDGICRRVSQSLRFDSWPSPRLIAGAGWWLWPTGMSGIGAPREDAVAALIGDWASALRSRDLDRHMSYYAPRPDQYFGRRGVDRTVVASEKRRQLDTRFRRIDAYDVAISGMTWTSNGEVAVRVRKRWDARRANGTRDTGEASHQLTIRRSDGQWRIVAETE